MLFTWAAGLYQDWLSGTDALILGAAVGAAAPLGDLIESAIKRDAGTKDAGTLFGAHGGALDRLDAAFFTLVAGYYVWLAVMCMDENERTERQMAELLQELRVALPGVQILFAFLLTVPFAQGFERVTSFQRDLFFATLHVHGDLHRLPDRADRHAPAALPQAGPQVRHRVRQRAADRRPGVPGAGHPRAVALITDFLFDGAARWVWPALLAW